MAETRDPHDPHGGARPRRGRGRDARADPRRRRSSDVELRIYEPPRFFEAFLRGRALHRGARHHRAHLRHLPGRVPDERVRGDGGRAAASRSPSAIRALRRLLYCGEWIESHALHVFMLHAPDFLGYDERVRDGARPPRDRRAGAAAQEGRQRADAGRSAGARSTRSTCASAASTARPTRARARARCVEQLEAAREFALEARALDGGARLPRLRAGLRVRRAARPGRLPIEGGRLVSTAGLDIAPREYEEHFVEEHVEHSTALHSRLRDGGAYLVGPLARYALNSDGSRRSAREAAADGRARRGVPQPVPQHRRARGRDPLRARRGAAADRRPTRRRTRRRSRSRRAPAIGYGWTEAPRGMLWHRYALDDDGTILEARIVPPTSQNQARIEEDLRGVRRAATSTWTTTSCSCAASRRSATTTRASPARRTS